MAIAFGPVYRQSPSDIDPHLLAWVVPILQGFVAFYLVCVAIFPLSVSVPMVWITMRPLEWSMSGWGHVWQSRNNHIVCLLKVPCPQLVLCEEPVPHSDTDLDSVP